MAWSLIGLLFWLQSLDVHGCDWNTLVVIVWIGLCWFRNVWLQIVFDGMLKAILTAFFIGLPCKGRENENEKVWYLYRIGSAKSANPNDACWGSDVQAGGVGKVFHFGLLCLVGAVDLSYILSLSGFAFLCLDISGNLDDGILECEGREFWSGRIGLLRLVIC